MKRLMVFGASLLFIVFSSYLITAIRINEVELNPRGQDSGNEWVELYSEEEINLDGWMLWNNDNQSKKLDNKFQGYLIIEFSGQWLDNSNEKIILKDASNDIIDETKLLSDSSNDDKTWQYCNGNWLFKNSTKEEENYCTSQEENKALKSALNNTPYVIRLGNKNKVEEPKSEIIYESGNEKVKKYSIYALNIIMGIIILLLLTSFKKGNN